MVKWVGEWDKVEGSQATPTTGKMFVHVHGLSCSLSSSSLTPQSRWGGNLR